MYACVITGRNGDIRNDAARCMSACNRHARMCVTQTHIHTLSLTQKYTQPKQVMLGSVFVCETDFWVPPMFALAAIILGVAYPLLDAKLELKEQKRRPSGSAILTCISFFCLQYYTSGLLTSVGVGGAPLHTVLAVTAAACWYVWDRTPTGTIMCVVTGLAGPAVEVGLLQGYPAIFGSELYHYSNPDVLGIPLWISWVYACGAPAVGGLARGLWNSSSQAPHS